MEQKTKPALKIINIGGTTDVTGNITVYESGDDIIVVDCGIGFPDADMPGVDVVIPDFSYILENRERVRALLITHAHEDHFGAVPFLLKELKLPVYGTKLVIEFVKGKLEDRASKQLAESTSFHELSPDTPEVTIGNFKISAYRVNHSVPAATSFAIHTPQGLILHMADYKIDWTPVLDKPIQLGRIAQYGDEGVLCLLSDCLGVTNKGYTESESSLNETFDKLFSAAEGRQIVVTSISSGLSRFHQIISAAVKHGRKVVLSGRSIQQSILIGRKLGYLKFPESAFVPDKQARKYAQKDLVHIMAGCYGQEGSALARASRGEHKYVDLEDHAMVIFSGEPNPPGTREPTEYLQDQLTLKGAEVIYGDIQDNLHVSGHGLRGDLTVVAAIAKPKYFMPIGGTVSKMRAYREMVVELGFDGKSVFEQMQGESVVFEGGHAKKGPRIEIKKVLMAGNSEDAISPLVVQDREVLSSDGVFVVVVPIDEKNKSFGLRAEVISRGFVYVKEAGGLVGGAKTLVNNLLAQNKNKVGEWGYVKALLEKEVSKYLRKETGRKPMVIVHGLKV